MEPETDETSLKKVRHNLLTWDALVVIYSHTGFTWKIMNLMLILQITGIKSKTEDKTGYHVRLPIQPQPISLRSTTTRLILSEFIAWSATGISRRNQENWVKASE